MDYLEIRKEYNYLSHSGVLGMRWGVRKYNNYDYTINASGKKRYGVDNNGNMSDSGKEKYTKDLLKQNGNDTISKYKQSGTLIGVGLGVVTGLLAAMKDENYNKLSTENKSKLIAKKIVGMATIGYILGKHYGKKFGKREAKNEIDYRTKL